MARNARKLSTKTGKPEADQPTEHLTYEQALAEDAALGGTGTPPNATSTEPKAKATSNKRPSAKDYQLEETTTLQVLAAPAPRAGSKREQRTAWMVQGTTITVKDALAKGAAWRDLRRLLAAGALARAA